VLARTDSRARALFLLIITTLLAAIVGGRLVWWQVADRERVATMALNQLAQNQEIPAARGEIRDANGVLLAISIEVQSVYATPPTVPDKERAATLLATVLGTSVAEMRARLTSTNPWVWLSRRIDPQTKTSADDFWIGQRFFDQLQGRRRNYRIGVDEPKDIAAGQLRSRIHLNGAAAR